MLTGLCLQPQLNWGCFPFKTSGGKENGIRRSEWVRREMKQQQRVEWHASADSEITRLIWSQRLRTGQKMTQLETSRVIVTWAKTDTKHNTSCQYFVLVYTKSTQVCAIFLTEPNTPFPNFSFSLSDWTKAALHESQLKTILIHPIRP